MIDVCRNGCRSLTYEAPSNEVLEALGVLVRYVTVHEEPLPAQGATPWLPLPPVVAAAPSPAAGRQGWRPPPRLGAAGAPAAQVPHCSLRPCAPRRHTRVRHALVRLLPAPTLADLSGVT